MTLFTEDPISTLQDLSQYESSVLELAGTEGIDLTAKLGIAKTEIGLEITRAFVRLHPSAERFSTGQISLEGVVVTSAIRHWHVLQTLALTYQDAFNRRLNDRYQGKWKEFRNLAKSAGELLFSIGVGIVWEPVPKAATPELGFVAGGRPPATYVVRVAWMNSRGEEGQPSNEEWITLPQDHALSVRAIAPPPVAVGWNVYAGFDSESLSLQNTEPIPAQAAWIEPAHGLISGRGVGNGQQANIVRGLPRVLQRG
ncbi:MAG: hypothetical protein WD696_16530 [Bryobacteraceae bacterium]